MSENLAGLLLYQYYCWPHLCNVLVPAEEGRHGEGEGEEPDSEDDYVNLHSVQYVNKYVYELCTTMYASAGLDE